AQEILEELRKSDPHRLVECAVGPQVIAHGDSHLLHVVMENLLQNAWKFTKPRTQAKIEFGVQNGNTNPSFYVKDNGVGFSMAYADRLFRPFQRLHDAREFPGTGIGLALTQRIIRRHHGEIWVEAEEHHGAAFFFTLPMGHSGRTLA